MLKEFHYLLPNDNFVFNIHTLFLTHSYISLLIPPMNFLVTNKTCCHEMFHVSERTCNVI